QRLATLIWMPGTTVNNTESPTTSTAWPTLVAWARKFLGDGTRAAALSAHLSDDNFFLELMVQGPLDRTAKATAHEFMARLRKLPDELDHSLAGLQPYAKPLLSHLSPMIKAMIEFTRTGKQGDLAELRCYLPAAAAHNLLMATELALAESANP